MIIKKKTIPTRIPKQQYDEFDNALNIRFKNNLITRKEFKMTEGFRLLGRMPEWKMALNKLKTTPKRKDLQ